MKRLNSFALKKKYFVLEHDGVINRNMILNVPNNDGIIKAMDGRTDKHAETAIAVAEQQNV